MEMKTHQHDDGDDNKNNNKIAKNIRNFDLKCIRTPKIEKISNKDTAIQNFQNNVNQYSRAKDSNEPLKHLDLDLNDKEKENAKNVAEYLVGPKFESQWKIRTIDVSRLPHSRKPFYGRCMKIVMKYSVPHPKDAESISSTPDISRPVWIFLRLYKHDSNENLPRNFLSLAGKLEVGRMYITEVKTLAEELNDSLAGNSHTSNLCFHQANEISDEPIVPAPDPITTTAASSPPFLASGNSQAVEDEDGNMDLFDSFLEVESNGHEHGVENDGSYMKQGNVPEHVPEEPANAKRKRKRSLGQSNRKGSKGSPNRNRKRISDRRSVMHSAPESGADSSHTREIRILSRRIIGEDGQPGFLVVTESYPGDNVGGSNLGVGFPSNSSPHNYDAGSSSGGGNQQQGHTAQGRDNSSHGSGSHSTFHHLSDDPGSNSPWLNFLASDFINFFKKVVSVNNSQHASTPTDVIGEWVKYLFLIGTIAVLISLILNPGAKEFKSSCIEVVLNRTQANSTRYGYKCIAGVFGGRQFQDHWDIVTYEKKCQSIYIMRNGTVQSVSPWETVGKPEQRIENKRNESYCNPFDFREWLQ